jgi:outer membrane protein assembly factor BamB
VSLPHSRRDVLRVGSALLSGGLGGCILESDSTSTTPTGWEPTETPAATPRDPKPLSVSGDWSTHQFDLGNTGHAPDATGVPDDGRPYWHVRSRHRGGGPGPAIVGGTLVVEGQSSEKGETVYARNARAGAIEWEGTPGLGISRTPTVEDGMLYVSSGGISAIDVANGQLDWQLSFPPEYVGSGMTTLLEGTVYAMATTFDGPSFVYAIDATTGEKQWDRELPAVESLGSIAVEGERLFLPTNEAVHALDRATGESLWQFDLTLKTYFSTPTVSSGSVYVRDREGRAYAISATEGTERWRTDPFEGQVGDVAVADETVFLGARDGLHAIDTTDGTERWAYGTDSISNSELPVGAPSVGEATVYFSGIDDDPRFYAVDATTGEERWSWSLPNIVIEGDIDTGGAMSPPTVVDDGVFIHAADGIYAFGPRDE